MPLVADYAIYAYDIIRRADISPALLSCRLFISLVTPRHCRAIYYAMMPTFIIAAMKIDGATGRAATLMRPAIASR